MNEHFTFHAEKNTLFQGKVLSWLLKKKKKERPSMDCVSINNNLPMWANVFLP